MDEYLCSFKFHSASFQLEVNIDSIVQSIIESKLKVKPNVSGVRVNCPSVLMMEPVFTVFNQMVIQFLSQLFYDDSSRSYNIQSFRFLRETAKKL